MANTHANATGKLCIRLVKLVRKAMSQPSVGKTLAPYNAESKINVRLIARGYEGATQGISRKRQIWGGMPLWVQLVDSCLGCIASVDSVAAAPFAGRNAANVLPKASECTSTSRP